MTVPKKNGAKNVLKQVKPFNVQNFSSGTGSSGMKLYADCGRSNSVVVGSGKRGAIYKNESGTLKKTGEKWPTGMKTEIMSKWLKHWNKEAIKNSNKPLEKMIDSIQAKTIRITTDIIRLRLSLPLASNDAERKKIRKKISRKESEMSKVVWSLYYSQSESWMNQFDKYIGINKYAMPDVGQGYTMSSGGAGYSGKKTWNFHWAGIVMKSNDSKDRETLENYSVNRWNVQNRKWVFQVYGSASKKSQTFHEQHHATKQHGKKPTTMVIEKQ